MPGYPDQGGCAVLPVAEYRYLVQILRKTAGDVLEVRFPDGSLSPMRITKIDRKEKRVFMIVEKSQGQKSEVQSPGRPLPQLVLFQWILKGPKMDQVIRQATETGVALIVPVAGERCLSREADSVGEGKTGRWERIVREARQQSGSPTATRVLSPLRVDEIPALLLSLCKEKKSLSMVLTEAPLARKSLHEYLVNGFDLAALAIGPEGGMTPPEMGILGEAGFVSIHFNTNILRAETAALYGIAAVQSAIMELEKWQLKE